MVTMRTRKLWTCWQGTLLWNAELPRKIRWYRNVVSRGSAVQRVALLPISAMRLWASSDKGPRLQESLPLPEKKHVSGEERTVACNWSTFDAAAAALPACSVFCDTYRMLPVCEQLSHPMWHCVPTAMIPTSSHRVSFGRLYWNPGAPWLLVFLPESGRSELSRWANHGAELCLIISCRTVHAGQEDPSWRRRGRSEPRRLRNPWGGDRRPCTRMALSSKWRPQALMGRVWSQSPLWGLPPPTIWLYDTARYDDWASDCTPRRRQSCPILLKWTVQCESKK